MTADGSTLVPAPEGEPPDSFTRKVLIATGFFVSIILLIILAWKSLYVLLLIFAGVLFGIYLNFLKILLAKYTRLPSSISLVAILVGLFLVIGVFIMLIAPIVQEQTMTLLEEIPESLSQLRVFMMRFPWIQDIVGETRLKDFFKGYDAEKIMEALQNVLDIFSTTFSAVTAILFIIIIGIYTAAEIDTYFNGIIRLVPPKYRPRAAEILYKLGHILRWWLLGQSLSMLLLGTLVFWGLWFFDIPYAFVLALFTAAMTFIPNLGPTISYIPTALVTLSMDNPAKLFYVTVFYIIIQTIEGFFITPMVHRKAITVPPMLIISFQVLLFQLIGFLGVILAMPLVACAMVLIQTLYVENILGDTSHKLYPAGPDAK